MGFYEWVILVIIVELAVIVGILMKMSADRKKREEEKKRYAVAAVWQQIRSAFATEGKVLTFSRYDRFPNYYGRWTFYGKLELRSPNHEVREVEIGILPDPIALVMAGVGKDGEKSFAAFFFPDEQRGLFDHLTSGDKK